MGDCLYNQPQPSGSPCCPERQGRLLSSIPELPDVRTALTGSTYRDGRLNRFTARCEIGCRSFHIPAAYVKAPDGKPILPVRSENNGKNNSGGVVDELKHVHVTIENSIAKLLIDPPPANALSGDVLSDLSHAVDTVATDQSVKVIIITGQGRFFVAGADINQLDKVKDAAEGEALAINGQRVLDKIEQLTKPVICAVNGMALGGGCELAMACHMRIAADSVKFGQPEINLGIIPGFGGTQRLSRIIGPSKATELILTGDMISAQDALRLGLVNAVVPAEDLEETVRKLAEKIASKSMPALKAALRSIGGGLNVSLADGLALEARIFGEVCETADKTEGIRAFLEKRTANFQDR